MEWTVDREADKPLYQQIFEFIEEKIAYGELPSGLFYLQNVNWQIN